MAIPFCVIINVNHAIASAIPIVFQLHTDIVIVIFCFSTFSLQVVYLNISSVDLTQWMDYVTFLDSSVNTHENWHLSILSKM